MTMPTDLLQRVLDGEAADSAEAKAIERDVDRIRRGMELAAGDPTEDAPRGTLLRPRSIAAAIALVAAVGVAVSNSRRDRAAPSAEPVRSATGLTAAAPTAVAPTVISPSAITPSSSNPGLALGVPARGLSLQERVQQADRIVVGTVTKITRGDTNGSADESLGAYVLATVSVSETIKGVAGDVVAFDYDYSGAVVTSEVAAKPWKAGQQVLLFLVSDAGTVSETLQPAHLQVAEGAAGRYTVKDGAAGAPFTLDDVRRLARR